MGAAGPERAARLVATLEAVADAAEAAAMAGHPDVVAGLRLDPTVPVQRRALLAAAVADVQHEYATWTVGNLVAAIDRRIGPLPADAGGQARPLYLEGLAGEAVAPGNACGVVLLTAPDPVEVPEELRRAAGRAERFSGRTSMSGSPPWTSCKPRSGSSPRRGS